MAQEITKELHIPTIGIGAGVHTDGQILVWHDVIGIQSHLKLSFIKKFTNTHDIILNAINTYAQAVQTLDFPEKQHTFE